MTNWQRVFAYITGALVFGLLLILASNSYLQYAAHEGVTGYLVLLGFGLVYLNLNFGLSRRFTIKALDLDWVSYLMASLTILPTIFWVYTKDVGLGQMQLLFVLVTIFSAFLGTYYGIRRGLVKRRQYIQRLREDDQELPDSLKRPHDHLSQN